MRACSLCPPGGCAPVLDMCPPERMGCDAQGPARGGGVAWSPRSSASACWTWARSSAMSRARNGSVNRRMRPPVWRSRALGVPVGCRRPARRRRGRHRPQQRQRRRQDAAAHSAKGAPPRAKGRGGRPRRPAGLGDAMPTYFLGGRGSGPRGISLGLTGRLCFSSTTSPFLRPTTRGVGRSPRQRQLRWYPPRPQPQDQDGRRRFAGASETSPTDSRDSRLRAQNKGTGAGLNGPT